MIGQKRLKNIIDKAIDEDKLSRFIILKGVRGSQKQEMAEYIADRLNVQKIIINDLSVDNIRNLIKNAYTIQVETVYVFLNIDTMSINAKNTILKVTEEPPNKARFIFTVQDMNNVLPTIKSRATVYKMNRISIKDLDNYLTTHYPGADKDIKSDILGIVETPYEIDLVEKSGDKEFISYVNKVVDNIAEVSGSNVFKIADKINLKTDDSKYDLKLFLKAFMMICLQRVAEDKIYYSKAVLVTNETLSQLGITGINKQMLFDKWLLDVRKVWME